MFRCWGGQCSGGGIGAVVGLEEDPDLVVGAGLFGFDVVPADGFARGEAEELGGFVLGNIAFLSQLFRGPEMAVVLAQLLFLLSDGSAGFFGDGTPSE